MEKMNYTKWWSSKDYVRMGIESTLGVGLMSTNLLLMLTIIYHKNLRMRKEYLVILGVAIADGLTGLGLFVTCAFALYGFMTGTVGYPLIAHECLTSIQPHLMITGMTAQALMVVAQSMDRLLAIAIPLRYFSFDTPYARGLIGFVFAYALGQNIVITYISWAKQTAITGDFCNAHHAMTPSCFGFWSISNTASGCLGVLLYVAVMVLYKRHKNKVAPSGPNKTAQKNQMKQQRKITLSMGISCLFTFLFFVLPRFAVSMFATPGSGAEMAMRTGGWILYNINPMLNLFIYVKRHKEIRLGVVYLFKLKYLPPLENLATTQTNKKTKQKSTKV